MPPPESNRQLTEEQVDLIKRWIDEGAAWGTHWAYELPSRPSVPAGASAIDYFIDKSLNLAGLKPNPPAERETVLRRVTLDLTGLPPTPAEIDDFLSDASPYAYERVVERLLNSPRFGQRIAWDWLDAARYADTNGFQGDPERTMWPWRDWVVNAFNANMPYDQFTIEQLAGDLLPDATRAQTLASAFNRNNMHNGEGGRIPEETRVENVFDRVETTATVWLGVTFTCCRCHDHKFDPFTMQDYFGLYDVFNQTSETGQGRAGQAAPILDFSSPSEEQRIVDAKAHHLRVSNQVATLEEIKFHQDEQADTEVDTAVQLPGNLLAPFIKLHPKDRRLPVLLEAISFFEMQDGSAEYVSALKQLLEAVRKRDAAIEGVTKVMVMDQIPEPRNTFILSKGAYDKPTETQVFAALPAALSRNSAYGQPAERIGRLELAQWLVSPENPLTARVTVNRLWQMFFGTGLVKTAEDFGVQGEKPTHPDLLDWLAVEFMHQGWDIKAICRLMVTSETYRRSSQVLPAMFEIDPDNRLLARGPRYRLPAWMLRDAALAMSGLLVDEYGGYSVFPYQPEGIWEEATFGKKTYVQDHGSSLYRRSLYIFWRRIVGPTMLFDNAARQTCSVNVYRTNTPLHALTTLNDIAYVEASRFMAQRVLQASPRESERIEVAFRLATGRLPTKTELEILQTRLKQLSEHYSHNLADAHRLLMVGEAPRDEQFSEIEHAAYTVLCSLILNLDEAISKE
jgi:hypothetical protein